MDAIDRALRARALFATPGFFFSILFVSSSFCALYDLFLPNLRIPMISGSIGLLFLFASTTRLGTVMSLSTSRAYLFMTAWFAIGVPLAVWRGGAADAFRKFWLLVIIAYFCVAGLCVTSRMVTRAVMYLSVLISITAGLILLLGTPEPFTGRIVLNDTRFNDPNDIAMMLVLGMPLNGFVALNPRLGGLHRSVGVVGLLLSALAFGRSGSRGGLLALLAVMLYLFWKVAPVKKILLLLTLLAAAGVANVVTPAGVMGRFGVFWEDEDNSNSRERQIAVDSRQARWALFIESLRVTMQHPIFGVGMGNFVVADNLNAVEQGLRHGAWHVTHNTYTEISSEGGVPPLIAFCVIMVWCWRSLTRLEHPLYLKGHPDQAQLQSLVFALRLTLVGFMVACFFLSVAYHNKFPVLVGLIAALHLAVQDELRMLGLTPGTAQTAVPVLHPGMQPVQPAWGGPGARPLPQSQPPQMTPFRR
jgi:O-antigen ligase